MIICGNGDLLIDVEKLLLNNKYLNYKIFKNLNEDKLSRFIQFRCSFIAF